MRIVSLLPSATEIVFALGLDADLAGVTAECDFPPEARTKRVLSRSALDTTAPGGAAEIDREVREKMDAREPLYALDREGIRELQPDLILAQDLCRVCAVPSGQVEEALADIGCTSRVISLDPFGVDDILAGILEVGAATATEARAETLVRGLRARVEAVRERAESLPPVRTFCLEWLDPPFVAGHWVPELVRVAGGEPLLNDVRQRSRVVRWDEVDHAGPEAIVFMPCGYAFGDAVAEAGLLGEVPELTATPAARNGRVFAVDATAYFSRPGPRIVDGLEILAWALHGEAFPAPPPGRVARIPLRPTWAGRFERAPRRRVP